MYNKNIMTKEQILQQEIIELTSRINYLESIRHNLVDVAIMLQTVTLIVIAIIGSFHWLHN